MPCVLLSQCFEVVDEYQARTETWYSDDTYPALLPRAQTPWYRLVSSYEEKLGNWRTVLGGADCHAWVPICTALFVESFSAFQNRLKPAMEDEGTRCFPIFDMHQYRVGPFLKQRPWMDMKRLSI